MVSGSVVGPPPGFNADPDPALYLNSDPDPESQTNADPDPGQTFSFLSRKKLNFYMKVGKRSKNIHSKV